MFQFANICNILEYHQGMEQGSSEYDPGMYVYIFALSKLLLFLSFLFRLSRPSMNENFKRWFIAFLEYCSKMLLFARTGVVIHTQPASVRYAGILEFARTLSLHFIIMEDVSFEWGHHRIQYWHDPGVYY